MRVGVKECVFGAREVDDERVLVGVELRVELAGGDGRDERGDGCARRSRSVYCAVFGTVVA